MFRNFDCISMVLVCTVFLFVCSSASAFKACEYADDVGIALYHMNENTGVDLYDAAVGDGFSDDAVLSGVTLPTWTTGMFGTSGIQLNYGENESFGQMGYVELPAGITNFSTNLTIEMYVNWDYVTEFWTPGDNACGVLFTDVESIFLKGHIDTSNPSSNTCYLKAAVRVGGGAWLEMNTPTEYNLIADQWTHVALTRELSETGGTNMKLYIDGELANSLSTPQAPWVSGGTTTIGTPGTNELVWGGQIDEFRITPEVLTKFGCLECGDWGYQDGDINLDCYVNIQDVESLAIQWLGTGASDFIGPYANIPGTLGLWHMDEGSGNTITDASGNGNTGTFQGLDEVPVFGTGRYGGGVVFDRSRDPGETSGGGEGISFASSLLHGRKDFTVQMNFKWDGSGSPIPGDNAAGWLYYDYETFFIRMHQGDGGGLYFRAGHRTADAGWEEVLHHPAELSANTWYDIACTRKDNGDGTYDVKIFVDGTEAATHTINQGLFTDSGSSPDGFGYVDPGGGWCIGGTIDEARILDYALDPSAATGPCAGLDYLPADLDESCDVTLVDYSIMAGDWLLCTDPDDAACVDCGSVTVEEFAVDGDTLALWHMNEGVGDALADATGSYELTNNGYIWSTGKFDDGLISKTSPDISYASAGPLPLVPADPNDDPVTFEMSMSAWVQFNPPVSANGSYILYIDTIGFIRIQPGGTEIAAGFRNVDGPGGATWMDTSGYPPFGGGLVYNDTNWHHVAAVYDGNIDVNNQVKVHLFWDGIKVRTASLTVDPLDYPSGKVGLVPLGSTGMLYVGNTNDLEGDTAFYGSVDEVRVSTTARDSFYPSACQ